MDIKIALAGNPNCGKTTLFNELTGSSQYVGNWSPYTLEETVTRKYLINEKPHVILNIIDGTNLERNLYLTTQLIEVGLPVVIAINMMDLVNKNGDTINLQKLSAEIGAPVYPISALEGKGCLDVAEAAVKVAENHQVFKAPELPHVFRGSVEHALAHIEESISDKVDKNTLRWFAIKLFERDEQVLEDLKLPAGLTAHLEEHIKDCEAEMDDDAESIITNQRYEYIGSIIDACITKNRPKHALTLSDKIDQVVTNRFLGLPIFFIIMTLMYYISITTVGGWMTDWTNDVFFGEIVTDAAKNMLESIAAPEWLSGLVVDGIIGGVGTVLGFVPQILLIFFFMSLLEDSGYMARVAFIMDRIFRQFGLSGKSFIPVLIGMGCGVPAIMAARTIEEERDRRMTILLATFIPCGAKAEIIGMITAVFFPNSVFMAPGMYFLGLAIIVLAGIALKKTSWFAGEPAPFVMELPAYHMPSIKGVLIHMWERARGFIIKAGMIIFPICVLLWFMQTYNFSFEMVEEVEESMLGVVGNSISWIFAPIGLGDWRATVASIAAFLAKEDAVGVLAMLAGAAEDAEEAQVMESLSKLMPPMAAFSYMILNLFDPPCLVAMATCYREMGSRKWGLFAIAFQAILGYSLAFVFYNLGSWYIGNVPFGPMQGIALFLILVALYFILRPARPYVKPQENVHA